MAGQLVQINKTAKIQIFLSQVECELLATCQEQYMYIQSTRLAGLEAGTAHGQCDIYHLWMHMGHLESNNLSYKMLYTPFRSRKTHAARVVLICI